MEQYHLSDSEYRFLQVVWAAEPGGLRGTGAPLRRGTGVEEIHYLHGIEKAVRKGRFEK